jgi:hypothetical protein
MIFKIYIGALFVICSIVLFMNVNRINKIARKYPGLTPMSGWSLVNKVDREKIRKYWLYQVLCFILFAVVIFFSYLLRFG